MEPEDPYFDDAEQTDEGSLETSDDRESNPNFVHERDSEPLNTSAEKETRESLDEFTKDIDVVLQAIQDRNKRTSYGAQGALDYGASQNGFASTAATTSAYACYVSGQKERC